MPGAARSRTALSGWLVILLGMIVARSPAAVPSAPPLELSQFGRPDAVQAARILEQFRQSGVLSEYFLEFELQTLPRRGESRVFSGRMWGGRNAQGEVNRIEVTDGEGLVHRLLAQNGANPAIWRLAGGVVQVLGGEALFDPLIPGIDLTAFDLQRSYLSWPDATLQSTNRVLGRPTYAFLFRAPAGFASGASGVAAARAYFDTVFNQPLQSELLDGEGGRLRTLSVVSLKTVDIRGPGGVERQTLPKEIDFRNERTRDKTRLHVTAIALHLDFPGGVFDPAGLASAVPAPPIERLTRIAP